MISEQSSLPCVLILASTYPRWRDDHEPAFVHELCRRLSGRFKVVALVPDAPGADGSGEMDGVEVIRYRYAPRSWQKLVNNGGIAANLRRSRWKWLLVPSFVVAQYLAARRIMDSHRIDVVHAHWLIPQGMIAWWLRRRSKSIPYLVTSHGGDLYGLRNVLLIKIKRRVAASASAMTVVSGAMATVVKELGIHAPRLEVLPMGVDLSARFRPDDHVQRAPCELLFVGRLVAKKGLRHLLDAMPEILLACPEACLSVVGFGPEEAALRAQANRLGLDARINFLGAMPQHELPDLYRRATVFVAPFVRDDRGDQEGLPVVLMEAIGCGCPVIVGAVAGLRDLLGDLHDDLTVEPGDTRALAAAVVNVLKDPGRSQQLAMRVRDAAVDRIDWEFISHAYGDLLQACMDGSPATDTQN